MGRAPNFAYSASPVEEIGTSLARALFGDPEAAAKQRDQIAQAELRAAQTRQADAHAGLYGSQTAGQNYQNTSARGFGDLVDEWTRQQEPAPVAMPSDDLAPLPEGAAGGYYPGQPDPAEAMRRNLGRAIAFIAGQQGDKVDMGDTVGALSAFLGNDEFARRGLIAQGHTPGKDFALTPGRADAIAQTGYDEDYRKATGVALINNRDDVPVANIQANASMRNQGVRSGDTRRGQDINSGDRRYATDSKGYDKASAVALGNSLGTVTSTVRTEKRQRELIADWERGGRKGVRPADNSHHLERNGGRGIDIARRPGVTHAQVVKSYRDKGYTILEQLDEGDHSHLALAGGPGTQGKGRGGQPKAPKGVTRMTNKMLSEELDNQLLATPGLKAQPNARLMIRERATRNYQQSGNAVEAVAEALRWARNNNRDGGAKRAAGGKPAPAPRGGAPVRIKGDEDYAKLKTGTLFIGPDGEIRQKT